MLSFLTISFCYKGCTFLFIIKIMCINQKIHQYLHFLFILKNKNFSSHTKVVARNSKSNILGDFICSKKLIVSPIMCYCLFVCCFTSQVNSYGHCGTVSSPNHTFFLGRLSRASG